MNLVSGEIEPDLLNDAITGTYRLGDRNLIDLDGLLIRSACEPTDDPLTRVVGARAKLVILVTMFLPCGPYIFRNVSVSADIHPLNKEYLS